MKIRTLTIIGFLLVSLTFTDCKKDFLDVKPVASASEASFYFFKSDAEQAITTIYAQLCYMTVWDKYILANLGSIASDDAEGGGKDVSDTPDMQMTDRFTYSPSIANALPLPYGTLFKSIFYANTALAKLPNIVKTDTTVTQGWIDVKLGEAKFLRALNYFYLVQIFGEVPLVDHLLGSSEYTMGRSPMNELFKLMEDDLTAASNILPASWPASEVGRATKGAAQGLLAKVLLFESSYAKNYTAAGDVRFPGLTEKWGQALTMAENVITSNTYKLVGIDGERFTSNWRGDVDGFRWIWSTEGDNSQEALFEIQNIADGKGWLKSRGNSITNWTCARYVIIGGVPANQSGYWGFNLPTQNLANDFEIGDPRFNTTIHKAAEAGKNGGNDSVMIAGGNWAKIDFNYECITHLVQAKYDCSSSEYMDIKTNWNEAPMNVRILRYADVVLIAAEAAYMIGNTAKALQYVNMIRTRARKCGVAGNTIPADLTSITLEDIQRERRVELAMEGHRFFDLVRWKLAKTKLDKQVMGDGVEVTFESPKMDFYPIPATEINYAEGNLKQYPGWE